MTLTDPLHIRVTQDFINEHSVVAIPQRSSRVPNGTGGFTHGVPVVQTPQTVRKVGLNSVTGVTERTTVDGELVLVTAMIVALPDANIQVGDSLAIGPDTFQVLSIAFDPPWRLQAEVYKRG